MVGLFHTYERNKTQDNRQFEQANGLRFLFSHTYPVIKARLA